MNRRDFLIRGSRIGAGVAGALALSACSGAGSETNLNVTVQDLAGQNFSLQTLKGKPSLVTFWATSCPGCIKEMPYLVRLHEQFADRGVTVLGIAMSYDNPDHVRNMVERKSLPYRIAYDESGAAAVAFGKVRLTPSTFVLDGNGQVRYRHIGEFDVARVESLLDKLAG
ncbi:MAG: peroxiredoxin family protein [Halothiobacillaceae bacterium]